MKDKTAHACRALCRDRVAEELQRRRGTRILALIIDRREHADWKAVDAAMIQAAGIARDVAAYRHAKLSAVRLAGEITDGPAASATLDELVEWIKAELTKLGPILELEVVREPEGSRSEGGLPQPN
jgi:hypothetical protein